MKVEVTEEGIVYCDGITCSNWLERKTTCENCPVDRLMMIIGNYFLEKLKQQHYGM